LTRDVISWKESRGASGRFCVDASNGTNAGRPGPTPCQPSPRSLALITSTSSRTPLAPRQVPARVHLGCADLDRLRRRRARWIGLGQRRLIVLISEQRVLERGVWNQPGHELRVAKRHDDGDAAWQAWS